MANNKVIFGNEVVMDITPTTATETDVANGAVFFKNDGTRAVGVGNYMSKIEVTPISNAILIDDGNGQAIDSNVLIGDVALKTELPTIATETEEGLVKTNPSQNIDVDSEGHLTVGGRLGQYETTTGLFAPNDRAPRFVNDFSLLITDAIGIDMQANRALAIVSGFGVACKSAQAGTTVYRVSNTYVNRIVAKLAEEGYASMDEATSKVEEIIPIVSVLIGGQPFTPSSAPNDSTKDIEITVAETLNPSSTMSNIRLFGKMSSYASAHIGNGIKSGGGGRSLMIGGGITKVNGNDHCIVGQNMYVSGNGNACFGRQHIAVKNRGLFSGTGHDSTNAKSESASAIGDWSFMDSQTMFAVGNGISHVARSNAFEVTTDGAIVLQSPNATRYKIKVDDSGNISTTAI